MLLTVAKALLSAGFLCAGLQLLRKAKKNRPCGDKPKEPVWWKAPERWVEDPELSGLFFAFMGAVGIMGSLWEFWKIAADYFAGK
jgi:hypothetical protein